MKKLSLFFLLLSSMIILSGCTPKFHDNDDYNELLSQLFAIFTDDKLRELDTEDRNNYSISAALWWCLDASEEGVPIQSCYVDFLVEYDALFIDAENPPRYAGFIRVASAKFGGSIIEEDYRLVLSTIYGTTRRENINAFREVLAAHKAMNITAELYEGRPLERRLP